MHPLVSQVAANIRERLPISRGRHILVAGSGGVDSMALLAILHRLAPSQRWRISIAHFNHRLRGRSSDADERLVRRAAERLAMKCFVESANIRLIARAGKISIEMAAREARHAFLVRAAAAANASVIALAHHADDQVEHFLLRLLRGSGPQGLAGMRWSAPSPADRRVRLVRPLLNVTKAELLNFARSERVDFRSDASNESPDFLRNRVRNELLPFLSRRFQPAVARIILRQMEILRAEAGFLDEAAANWCKGKSSVLFDRLHVALQRRVLQSQAFELGVPVDFELIERLRGGPDARVAVSPELVLIRNRKGRLEKAPSTRRSFNSAKQLLELEPGSNEGSFHSLDWAAKVEPWRRRQIPEKRPGREWFDADRVGASVVLRYWRRGDCFQPSGMTRPVKLQDLFTNLKVPAAERHERVVAATRSGELWWVEGLRIAETFKIRPETMRALRWEWRRATPI